LGTAKKGIRKKFFGSKEIVSATVRKAFLKKKAFEKTICAHRWEEKKDLRISFSNHFPLACAIFRFHSELFPVYDQS
jgi:hypothetical protein